MVDSAIAIRALTPEDLGATAALLAQAMDDDPAYNFIFPRGPDRPAGLEDFFARNLRTHLPYRCTYVGVVGPTVVATVTMRPPDGVSISMLTMMRQGLLPFAYAHGLRAVRRVLILKGAYDAIETRLARGERHWLVHMMAVDPACHGGGLGSQLLHFILDATVDARTTEGMPPAVLTTQEAQRRLLRTGRIRSRRCPRCVPDGRSAVLGLEHAQAPAAVASRTATATLSIRGESQGGPGRRSRSAGDW